LSENNKILVYNYSPISGTVPFKVTTNKKSVAASLVIGNVLDYKVSTITMSLQIPNCNLNLMNIGKYLEIDDNIIGIKYNFGKSSILKGKYSTSIYKKSKTKNQNKINKTLFYNQVSIIVNLNPTLQDKIINVKLFGNGSLHLTGVKYPSEGKEIIILLYAKLLDLCKKYDTILLTSDVNNVYLDNNNNVYNRDSNNKTIIGFKYVSDNEVLYNIHKKDYIIDPNTTLFISKKFESKRTKPLLNLNGEKVGVSRIELLKNKSKLYKNNSNVNFDYQNGFIYYDGDGKSNIIGKIVYDYTDNIYSHNTNHTDIEPIIEYKYNCSPFLLESTLYTIENLDKLTKQELQSDINCINIYLKLDFELNRQRLFNELIKKSYITEYKPEKYSGVKLRYKISKQSTQKLGLCECTNKCTCNNITFLIFQSGNIIVTGFKSLDDIHDIVNNFKTLILSIKNTVRMKTFKNI
jgi:TATA-box binding protein (TBP) (component of TFIID and TFIIIB)